MRLNILSQWGCNVKYKYINFSSIYAVLTSDDDIKKMNKILDLLDDDDDVQNVYHNWEE